MASSQDSERLASSALETIIAPISPPSHNSQTASDYISNQLRLEADAREVLPYSFDHCTQPLGPLRQNLFACLTCNPPPDSPSSNFTPAAVCYSCSISCHGEHTLVELFARRNFVCDCGTARLPATSSCTLRIDPATGLKGPVHSQEPAKGNTYNQNVRNRFCGCEEWYDPAEEKGTMFQCLGLVGEAEGGCGEDWWHPECVMWGGEEGSRRRAEVRNKKEQESKKDKEAVQQGAEDEEEAKAPDGFPDEDSFDTFICYKCINAVPWIKRYAGTEGFLPAVFLRATGAMTNGHTINDHTQDHPPTSPPVNNNPPDAAECTDSDAPSQNHLPTDKKRTASTANLDSPPSKRPKQSPPHSSLASAYHTTLPPLPIDPLSLFCKADFRDQLCRCAECYPRLSAYPQLLEEEEKYSPPLSEDGEENDETGDGSVGSKSLMERGEAALSNVDRVRAIGAFFLFLCFASENRPRRMLYQEILFNQRKS